MTHAYCVAPKRDDRVDYTKRLPKLLNPESSTRAFVMYCLAFAFAVRYCSAQGTGREFFVFFFLCCLRRPFLRTYLPRRRRPAPPSRGRDDGSARGPLKGLATVAAPRRAGPGTFVPDVRRATSNPSGSGCCCCYCCCYYLETSPEAFGRSVSRDASFHPLMYIYIYIYITMPSAGRFVVVAFRLFGPVRVTSLLLFLFFFFCSSCTKF